MDEQEHAEAVAAAGNAADWAEYFRLLRQGHTPKVTRADVELPPAEHTSRDPWPEDFPVPSGAASLRKVAEGTGWVAAVAYARGWKWGVGANMKLVHTVALKLHHPTQGRAVAVVYEAKTGAAKLSWAADSVWVVGQGFPPYGGMGVTDLRKLLEREWTTDGLRVWLEVLKEEAQAKADEAKARAKDRPKKTKERVI